MVNDDDSNPALLCSILVHHRLNHGLYVAELVGPRLAHTVGIFVSGRVVGDAHVLIAHFFECLHVAVHVHHPFIRPDLLELVALADDVAEMAEENFVA